MPPRRRSMLCRGGAALSPRGSGAHLLAAPAVHDAAVLTERTIRSAFAVVVAAQPDALVSVALARPTAWTAEQVTAAAAAAAATATPRGRDPARPGGGGRGGGLPHDGHAGGRRRRATSWTPTGTGARS